MRFEDLLEHSIELIEQSDDAISGGVSVGSTIAKYKGVRTPSGLILSVSDRRGNIGVIEFGSLQVKWIDDRGNVLHTERPQRQQRASKKELESYYIPKLIELTQGSTGFMGGVV